MRNHHNSQQSRYVFNMAANVYVRVSGPALSFLLYENVKCLSDQEGFLLGEVADHVTDTISDSQMRGEKTETLISVNSLMPVPNGLTFYNGVGKIDRELLKEFLKDKEKEVVGWYSFRRNSVLNLHLREKLLHKELCSFLSHLSPEFFTTCLLNTSVSTAGSTHIFNHKFIRYRHRMFEPLSVQIHNLGEAPQSDYKTVPSTACMSDSFNNIISTLRNRHEVNSDATLVCAIQRALQEHLRKIISDVELSEKKIAELEKEIESLRLQPGPVSNEILLPQILKEEVPPAINNNSNTNSKLDSTTTVEQLNPIPVAKVNKNLNNNHNSNETNHVEATAKEEATVDQSSTSDAFDFVNDVKKKMIQPQNVKTELSAEKSSVNSSISKRMPESGRGVPKGIGRGSPKQVQSKNTVVQDIRSNLRRAAQTQSSGTISTTPVKNSSPNINTVNSPKTRAGYANALKKPVVSAENKSPKPSNVSPTPANNTQTDSQEY